MLEKPVEHYTYLCQTRHTCAKDVGASVTPHREVVIMAVRAVGLLILGGKRLVDQRDLTVGTVETFLVPVFVLVGQILYDTNQTQILIFHLIRHFAVNNNL